MFCPLALEQQQQQQQKEVQDGFAGAGVKSSLLDSRHDMTTHVA